MKQEFLEYQNNPYKNFSIKQKNGKEDFEAFEICLIGPKNSLYEDGKYIIDFDCNNFKFKTKTYHPLIRNDG